MTQKYTNIIKRLVSVSITIAAISLTIIPANAQILFESEFLIENSGNAWIFDAGDDTTGNIILQFGNTLGESIMFDVTNNWFELSNDLNLNQHELKNVVIDNASSDPTSPISGQIYHNTTDGNTYIYNGSSWEDVTASGGGGGEDLDDVYDNDTDKILNVDNASGLEIESTVASDIIFDLQSTGDLVIQDNGTKYSTFTDTGEFQLDNLQLDANTISSTNTNGNITLNPDGNGFVNLNAEINITGNTVILDSDNSGGNITLQFGQILAKTLNWDSANTRFNFNDDVKINNTLLIENTTANNSFQVNDQAADTTPFVIDAYGNIGIGTSTPGFNLHLVDSGSSIATKWQVFDDGTNQTSILTGTLDPTSTATDADIGSIFLNTNTGQLFLKQDDGATTNWNLNGFDDDLLDALQGTFGTPSITNKFVTDEDPRLSQNSGDFGEAALGTRLDYNKLGEGIDKKHIYYMRIFLPSDTTVNSIGTFTVSDKTGDINMGIYSDNNGPDTRLAETGTQTGSTSPENDFWKFNLTSPLTISTAGFYWVAIAVSVEPKAATYQKAEDIFIPYRIEEKDKEDTSLPTTANPKELGNSEDIPYVAAFE